MKRTLLSWSSGKDSAWSLQLLRQQKEYDVIALLTTFNRAADRVAMHGVRRTLVRAQAQAAGIPLWEVDLPWPCSNQDYESAMQGSCRKAVQAGIECVAFGDLFLTEVRQYREKQLQGTGLQPVFPLWGLPTRELAQEMIACGMRARGSPASTRNSSARILPAVSSTRNFCRICRLPLTHAARKESSIRSSTPVRCSGGRFR